jgi:hypothetical protein
MAILSEPLKPTPLIYLADDGRLCADVEAIHRYKKAEAERAVRECGYKKLPDTWDLFLTDLQEEDFEDRQWRY